MTDVDDLQVNCTYYHDYEKYWDPTMAPWVKILFAIFYSILFVLGLTGNVAIITVTGKNRALQTVQNLFIVNLAVADLLLCFLSLPFTPIQIIYKLWYFGAIMCKVMPMVMGMSQLVCSYSLCVIAFDRYKLICHPHGRALTPRQALIIMAVTWAISVGLTSPHFYYMGIEVYSDVCGEFCNELWDIDIKRQVYTVTMMLLQFAVPFVCIVLCYLAIFQTLHQRANRKLMRLKEQQLAVEATVNAQNESSSMRTPSEAAQSVKGQTRRTTLILGSMVVIYVLNWLPTRVVNLLLEFHKEFFLPSWYPYDLTWISFLCTHCFAMTNIVANPVLYAWLNQPFRQTLTKMLDAFCKRRQNTGDSFVTDIVQSPKKMTNENYRSRKGTECTQLIEQRPYIIERQADGKNQRANL